MNQSASRRQFLATSAAALASSFGIPHLALGNLGVARPMTRTLGRTGLEVTTLGLGGQASLMWTPDDVDPAAIIVKSLEMGVNYFDTSNAYGPSQVNFGKAFQQMHLVPGLPGYNDKRRRSVYLASKTMVRHAKGSHPDVRDTTQGRPDSKAVDDLRRTLTQVFGDGKGNYDDDAYVDLFLIHNLNTLEEVDAIYHGLDAPDPAAERIGAFAALRDYRDGTNLTGLNPKEEKRIRHIGISGHSSSPVMIECLQRDENNLIDAMLIAINANDRLYLNHQYNVIEVAAAKNVGQIGMKVFADGAMYAKAARWSRTPEDVFRAVGSPQLPSRPLVEYAMTTPGIATTIIGIGQIDNEARSCQLVQNLSAAQIRPDALGKGDREEIERLARLAKDGETNWFQLPKESLGAPREVAAEVARRADGPEVRITWHMAYAADSPISHYEIRRGAAVMGRVDHLPQTTKAPFAFVAPLTVPGEPFRVATIDAAGRSAESVPISPKAVS